MRMGRGTPAPKKRMAGCWGRYVGRYTSERQAWSRGGVTRYNSVQQALSRSGIALYYAVTGARGQK